MKVVSIGDLHGRDTWKYIVNKEIGELDPQKDKIVFMGDYLDSLDPKLNGLKQTRNYSDIIKFKEDNKEMVELLFGNHEYHYLRVCPNPYSGYQPVYSEGFREMLEHQITKGNHKMIYGVENFLFSHAGLSLIWCKNNNIDYKDSDRESLVNEINDLFYFTPYVFNFATGRNLSSYGDDVTQSPIWIRRSSLYQSAPLDYSQVVGHTPQKAMNREILQRDPVSWVENQLIFTDTIHNYGGKKDSEYLKIEFSDNVDNQPIIEYKKL